MPTPPFLARGSVLLARFPFDSSPKLPGPSLHFCLFVEKFDLGEVAVAAMAYGTSRLDETLLREHRGLILSVPAMHLRGAQMPAPVTHFVMDHVAVLPLVEHWYEPSFTARLACFKPADRADPLRRRLLEQFEQFEPVLRASAVDAVQDMHKTRMFGLPEGKRLRKRV